MRILASQPGIPGLFIGFAAGFLMYASDLTASIAAFGVIGCGILLGMTNRDWVIEVFSLVAAMIAGSLCSLTIIVWKRDPTAHNLWPFELVMLALVMSGLLLLSGGGGALVRRHLLHWKLEPRSPAFIPGWIVPIATIVATVVYVLIRGAMLDTR